MYAAYSCTFELSVADTYFYGAEDPLLASTARAVSVLLSSDTDEGTFGVSAVAADGDAVNVTEMGDQQILLTFSAGAPKRFWHFSPEPLAPPRPRSRMPAHRRRHRMHIVVNV